MRHSAFALAVLALFLVVAFYALALGTAGLLLYLPYAEFHYGHRFSIRLTVLGLAGAFTIVRACVFVPVSQPLSPGPELRDSEQPELFARIREIASRLKTRMPAHIYLIPEVNAFVSEIGGFLGFGTTRIMGIGLGLLYVDTVSGFDATIAHEFGHFVSGHTRLGAVVYRARIAMVQVLHALGNSRVMHAPVRLYAWLFLRLTQALARQQELDADRVAVALIGRAAHVEALQRESDANQAFDVFVREEITPLVARGICPTDIYGGFSEARNSPRLQAAIRRAAAEHAPDPFDSHPPLDARIRFANGLANSNTSEDTRLAIRLLRRPEFVETELEPYLLGALAPRAALRRLRWDELSEHYYTPKFNEAARSFAERLFPLLGAGPPYKNIAATFLAALPSADLATFANVVEPTLRADDGNAQRAAIAYALGVLLGVSLVERGGRWENRIADTPFVALAGVKIEVFDLARDALATPERIDTRAIETLLATDSSSPS